MGDSKVAVGAPGRLSVGSSRWPRCPLLSVCGLCIFHSCSHRNVPLVSPEASVDACSSLEEKVLEEVRSEVITSPAQRHPVPAVMPASGELPLAPTK